ncbi:MAG TPA: gluconeogenesis factor YvcK family protein [Candidatus Saccharimonadales bacterium]|nr:gluconeogenesis factor YvcK family protein [Candidatus Saccharimonadales bacterium]
MKRIAVIGGGHGSSIVLTALKDSGRHLSAILSMTDDGGSTGRLKKELGTSAAGDIRQCLVALADNPEVAKLFGYRFESGELSGHSLGNLFLAAGELQHKDIEQSIEIAKKALKVGADVIPSTLDRCELQLDLQGKHYGGVYEIANKDFDGIRPHLSIEPSAGLSKTAGEAVRKADFIIIAPGNFYCSIMPALMVQGMVKAINEAPAKVILVANLINRIDQTGGFNATDYVDEIRRLAGDLRLDALIYNTSDIAKACLREGEEPVRTANAADPGYSLVGREISDDDQVKNDINDKIAHVRSLARHDKAKLAAVLEEVMDN